VQDCEDVAATLHDVVEVLDKIGDLDESGAAAAAATKLSSEEEWKYELAEAETALEAGAAALIDFLEALNVATEKQRQRFDEVRNTSGPALKDLRWQLQQLQERRQKLLADRQLAQHETCQ